MSVSTLSVEDEWELSDRRFDWAAAVQPRSFLLWLVAGWIALYIVRPWEILIPELENWRFERVYCLFVLGITVASGKLRIDFSRQTIAISLLFLSMILSTVFSTNAASSADELYKMFTLFAVYLVVLAAVRKPEDLVFLSLAYVAIMAAYLAKCEWEYFIHGRAEFAMGVKRLQGINITHGHPNGIAAAAVLSMPFWYFLWQRRKVIYASIPRLHALLLKVLLAAYAVIAFSAVLLTNSRSGMLGFALFIFLSAAAGKSTRRMLPSIMASTALIALLWLVFMPETQQDRLRTLWDPNAGPGNAQASVDGRFAAAMAGFEMFRDSPLLGVGLHQYKPYRKNVLYGYQLENTLSAHNLYSRTLGEQGIIGGISLMLFLLAIGANFRQVRKMTREPENEELEVLHLFARTALTALILLVLFGLVADTIKFDLFWLAAAGVAAVGMTTVAVQRADAENQALGMEYGHES